jgi:hypothetical protein
MVDDECVDLIPLTHASKARSSKLRAIGNDDRTVGRMHHAAFGFHQEHVAVVEAFFVDTCDAQECFLHIDRFEHLIGVGSVGNSSAVMDCTSEDHQVDRIGGREEIGNRQRVGHDLKRTADELFGKFVGGASAVEQNRIMVVYEFCGLECDGSFLVPSPIVGVRSLELTDAADGSCVEDPAVGPSGFSGLFERFEISADGRLADIQGVFKFWDRNEPLEPDKLQHSSPTGHRRVRRGLGIHQNSVEIDQNWHVFCLMEDLNHHDLKEKHSFLQKYVIFWGVFNRQRCLFCLIRTN